MPTNAFSIHGHFYQPPREDPLTDLIPNEPGAAPFKNWNERIHHECYLPNVQLHNFERISFNVGPTLFSWLESYNTYTYQQIISQDRLNFQKYGIGNAIAQAYNHTILPLATSSDKRIQIQWGISDFTHRFEHRPHGMWLPETAVDYETLSILANQGIEFTILAPWQAEQEGVDTTEPYRVLLPGGSSIIVFFFDQDLSAKISFVPDITRDAAIFAEQELLSHHNLEKMKHGEDQLILLATDGELYGHHQPFRERFLAQLLDVASAQKGNATTFPALWLKSHPPRKTIHIRDLTSWSCHHGVSRWTGECTCTPLDGLWKSHLRHTLNRLAAALDGLYLDTVYSYIPKPRLLLQRFIHVMLGEIGPDRLITEMADHPLTSDQMKQINLLLKSQHERQRMFTSCGWFFEDFDRIEPKNVLAYAAQAVRLARQATGDDLSPQVLADLKHVVSPRTKLTADKIFYKYLTLS